MNWPAESKILFRRLVLHPFLSLSLSLSLFASPLFFPQRTRTRICLTIPSHHRVFENDRLCIMGILDPVSQSPYYLIRSYARDGSSLFCQQGVHELCISRDGPALFLKRWSLSEQCSKLWAVLNFLTWEGKVHFPPEQDEACRHHLELTQDCRTGLILLYLRSSQGPRHVDCSDTTG
jgi:hypothetical protein